LWHERIIVGLAPDRLSALWLGGLLKPRLLDRHAIQLHGQDAGQWDRGLDALEALLSEAVWKGRDIAVILSSHYVRHAIFPASRGLSDTARQALAEVVFRETFGDLARDWELRVSPAAAGKQTLACGVPRSLLAALRIVCGGRGRLYSIQPGLMPVFNQIRQQIGKSVCHLALVETGRITLAFIEDEQWRYIESRAGDGKLLPQLLLEDSELNQRQPGGILWLCDLTETAVLPAGALWSHKRIVPPSLVGFDGISNLAIWGIA
jgi:hypothetical protein